MLRMMSVSLRPLPWLKETFRIYWFSKKPLIVTGSGYDGRLFMCDHKSKRVQKKVKVSEEEIPCAYAATQTRVVLRMTHKCDDCDETWTEEKEKWSGI